MRYNIFFQRLIQNKILKLLSTLENDISVVFLSMTLQILKPSFKDILALVHISIGLELLYFIM
jgi:hypothetical protein